MTPTIRKPPSSRFAIVALVAVGCSAPAARPGAEGATTGGEAPAPIAFVEASDEAFADARARGDRLILLSIQADWCHWCHVMNERTFHDAGVVAEVDAHFVALRADADARPDLAERYAAWGWPATILLTSEGREIAAVRGFREPAAFRAILEAAVRDPSPHDIFALSETPRVPADAALEARLAFAEEGLDRVYDTAREGWGTPQKYPFGELVLASSLRADLASEVSLGALHRGRAERSLAAYVGLIDPVWGGIYQYSERADWEHPHYERIATVQANSLAALADAMQRAPSPRWREAGQAIVRFVEGFTVLPTSSGVGAARGIAFATSMDADLRDASGEVLLSGADFARLDDAGRRARGIPRVDPTPHAVTQGQLAAALAAWALALGPDDPAHGAALELATRALAFAEDACVDRALGLARHVCTDDARDPRLHLADQVALAHAELVLGLAELALPSRPTTSARAHLGRAHTLATTIEARFCDRTSGCRATFDPTPARALAPVLAEVRAPLEENARFAQVLLRLADLGAEPELADRARQYLSLAATPDAIARAGRIVGDFVAAAHLSLAPRAVLHVVGPRDDTRTHRLIAAARPLAVGRTTLEHALPDESRYPYPDAPTVYLCSLDACSPPVDEPSELPAALARFYAQP